MPDLEPDDTTDTTGGMREFAAELFRRAEDPDEADEHDPAPDPTKGNVAPKEGNNPSARASADQEMREFAAELFGRDPYA